MTLKLPRATWSVTRKKRISIARDRCFLTVSFVIPTAVMLSQWTGVGGCGCPSSSNARRSIVPSWML